MILIITLISFVIGVGFAYFVSEYGLRFGFIDIPNNRSSHKEITPRGGGFGIPIALLFVFMFFIKDYYIVIFISIVLSFFSLIDDKISLPAFLRFIVEIVFASVIIVVYKNDLIKSVKFNYALIVVVFMIVLLAFIITAATNFFNFMDGINGIAGIEAIISFSFIAVYTGCIVDNQSVFLIAISIIASSIGFLIFNFPKARVFMGDTGSIFIGFLFASLVVILAKDIKELLVLLSFQGAFYIDCIITIFIRIYRKENILRPHLQHLYQRLIHQKKMSHVKVTVLYCILQIIIGIMSLLFLTKSVIWIVSFWLLLIVLYVIVREKLNKINGV